MVCTGKTLLPSLGSLGRVDEPKPEARGGQVDEGEEALGRLVVARGDGPELLEPVHQPLDPVPQPVQLAVERDRPPAYRPPAWRTGWGGITGRTPRSSSSCRSQSAS